MPADERERQFERALQRHMREAARMPLVRMRKRWRHITSGRFRRKN